MERQLEGAGGVIYECGKGSWVFMYPSPGAGTSKTAWFKDTEGNILAISQRLAP